MNAVGFIIYRTDYSDEEQWNRFMRFPNNQAHRGLIANGKRDMIQHLDWKVQVRRVTIGAHEYDIDDSQSDPDLQDAGPMEIREHFNRWLESGEEPIQDNYRYMACVLVDKSSLNCVDLWMEDKTYEDDKSTLFDSQGITSVCLVSRDESEGEFDVGVSYLFPDVAFLIQMEGDEYGTAWEQVAVPLGKVATPWR